MGQTYDIGLNTNGDQGWQCASAAVAICTNHPLAGHILRGNSDGEDVLTGTDVPSVIYALVRQEDWEKAKRVGQYNGSADDVADGFLHFSTGAQVRESARKHRSGEPNLLLVEVAVEPLGKALRWEHSSKRNDRFPHLYEPLKLAHVSAVRPLALLPDGSHFFPDEIPESPH